MRYDKLDDIKIIEPPIEEINKRSRSGFKKACLTGCGCIVFLIILAIVGFRIATGPGPQTLKNIPDTFPESVHVYDEDSIDTITFISGKYKNRGVEIAAIFPKIILSPLLLSLNKDVQVKKDKNIFVELWDVITLPVGDSRNTVQIEWRDLNADNNFIINFYKNELKKEGFEITAEEKTDNKQEVTFSKDKISGTFFTQNQEGSTKGTGYAVLTVNTPQE